MTEILKGFFDGLIQTPQNTLRRLYFRKEERKNEKDEVIDVITYSLPGKF